MLIPKITHRIWFGEPFPEKYREYISTLSALNPDYTIKLWSDPVTMSAKSYEELHDFCVEHRIVLCNIREQTGVANYPLIIEENTI